MVDIFLHNTNPNVVSMGAAKNDNKKQNFYFYKKFLFW